MLKSRTPQIILQNHGFSCQKDGRLGEKKKTKSEAWVWSVQKCCSIEFVGFEIETSIMPGKKVLKKNQQNANKN